MSLVAKLDEHYSSLVPRTSEDSTRSAGLPLAASCSPPVPGAEVQRSPGRASPTDSRARGQAPGARNSASTCSSTSAASTPDLEALVASAGQAAVATPGGPSSGRTTVDYGSPAASHAAQHGDTAIGAGAAARPLPDGSPGPGPGLADAVQWQGAMAGKGMSPIGFMQPAMVGLQRGGLAGGPGNAFGISFGSGGSDVDTFQDVA
jgi:hypothetical protein